MISHLDVAMAGLLESVRNRRMRMFDGSPNIATSFDEGRSGLSETEHGV